MKLLCSGDDAFEFVALDFDAVVAFCGPVDVVDGGDPCGAELAGDGWEVVLHRCKGDQRGEHSSSLR